MLDGYIIERIRRDRERARSEDTRIPLHIEPTSREDELPPEEPRPERGDTERRGSVTVDFQL